MSRDRLDGMHGIGVDRMGAVADGLAGADVLRLENLDTDLRPHPDAIARIVCARRRAMSDDRPGGVNYQDPDVLEEILVRQRRGMWTPERVWESSLTCLPT